MSLIVDTIRNKRNLTKMEEARRKEELNTIKDESTFQAIVCDEFVTIQRLFEDDSVQSVEIEVESRYLAKFSLAIYSSELSGYDIVQKDNCPNIFIVKRKYISY